MIILLTVSCGSSARNDLMEGASPQTSAITLYRFNGTTIYCADIFDSELTQQVIDELSSVKATEVSNWSLNDTTLPVFGISMGTTSGNLISAAWSNGYWITQSGDVYKFNFDFNKLLQDHDWESRAVFQSISSFPNAHLFTRDENGWNSTFLTAAREPDPPEGISMILNSWDEDQVSVYISNNTDAEWMYGQHYSLHVLIDDDWYDVPLIPGGGAFTDIGLIVPANDVQTQIYNLFYTYGDDLPAGTYRLVAYGLSVEHTIS